MASVFSNISPISFTTSAVILANILIDDLDIDEQNTLANWLQLVGQVILTNAGQVQLIMDSKTNNNDNDTKVQIKG